MAYKSYKKSYKKGSKKRAGIKKTSFGKKTYKSKKTYRTKKAGFKTNVLERVARRETMKILYEKEHKLHMIPLDEAFADPTPILNILKVDTV